MKQLLLETILAAISLAFFNDNRSEPLCVDQNLVIAAEAQNQDMQGAHGFNHADNLADLLPERYEQEYLGEILGKYNSDGSDYPNTAEVMNNAWRNSPTHWEVIVNPVYDCVGISYQQDSNNIWWATARFSSCNNS